jgi:small ligand-binding sensory domain FIST
MEEIKAYLLLTAIGAELVMTQHDLSKEPAALKDLASGGLNKFVAYEIPLEEVKKNYRAHFEHVFTDPKEKNKYIILDADGQEVFKNIHLKEIKNPIIYEQEKQAVTQ